MTAEIPLNTSENKETLDDNARKFVVSYIEPSFVIANESLSYSLAVDWLETGTDNEKKVVYKKYDNGNIQMLLVSKITDNNGNRTSKKSKIDEETYEKHLASSTLHLEKTRHELTYIQQQTSFTITYDEFTGGELHMLEVDAADQATRNSFNPDTFPASMTEVTGDLRYYGYRVATIV